MEERSYDGYGQLFGCAWGGGGKGVRSAAAKVKSEWCEEVLLEGTALSRVIVCKQSKLCSLFHTHGGGERERKRDTHKPTSG